MRRPRILAAGKGGWMNRVVRVSVYVALSLTAVYAMFAGCSIMKGRMRRDSTAHAIPDSLKGTDVGDALGNVPAPISEFTKGADDGASPRNVIAPWEPAGCQTLLFFHVPKTGGESMNALWWTQAQGKEKRFGWAGYQLSPIRDTKFKAEDQIRLLLNKTPWLNADPRRRHHIIEFHCGNAISFMQARKAIGAMREHHEKNDCGFFAFTLIRSPLEWLVSLYDDICHRRLKGHMDTCPQKEGMTPREEMLEYPHRDGTISYLMHGWKGWDSPGPVEEADVEEVYRSLESYLDLVAFTEEVPKLRHYLTMRFAAPNGVLSAQEEADLERTSIHNANRQKTVSVSDFTEDELKRLNATIQLDWKLFEALGNIDRSWW